MKNLTIFTIAAIAVLGFSSCDKPNKDLEAKLGQLEKQAAEATERQQQLESELAEQRFAAEMEAIERERTLIEAERLEMLNNQQEQDAALAAELEKRQQELEERERKIAETQQELDARQRELTGLEEVLHERDMEQAGREPLESLPPIQNINYGPPTGDFDNFYEPLADYGSWFNTADYGYVFQPTIVRDISWRPYTRGRWAFTDQGWTWVSNEPFGWACYHYGRWALLRNQGWVWIPGDEWAPAWVTWRESPGYVGWAPLPPETLAWRDRSWDSSVEVNFGIGSSSFSFVSYENFGYNIHSHCLPVTRNVAIIRLTTNTTHYRIDNRRIFVGGPRYQTVCDRIGRRFPVHQIRVDQRPGFRRGGSHLNNRFSGRDLEVVAPRMDAAWNPALRPSRIRRDLGDVSVERSRDLPKEVRERFRDRRDDDARQAEKFVEKAGGREQLDGIRKRELEENRDRDAKRRERSRGPERRPAGKSEAPAEPPVTVIPTRPERPSREGREGRDQRSRDGDPAPSVPEMPSIPGSTPDPIPEVITPERPVEPEAVNDREARRREITEQLEERKAQQEEARRVEREAKQQAARKQEPDTQPEAGSQSEEARRRALETLEERKAQQEKVRQEKELREVGESAERATTKREEGMRRQEQEQQEQEQEQEQEQQAQGATESKREESRRKALEMLEQRKAQAEEEAARRAQQKEAQRGQNEEMKKQGEQQQEEMRRRQQEQQETIRQQREETARRAQQEEAQRGQQEEMQRRQQEQQERIRQQQEETARRAQHEEGQRRQQEEMQRRQEEQQQERARRQQEEGQRQQQERGRDERERSR